MGSLRHVTIADVFHECDVGVIQRPWDRLRLDSCKSPRARRGEDAAPPASTRSPIADDAIDALVGGRRLLEEEVLVLADHQAPERSARKVGPAEPRNGWGTRAPASRGAGES